MPAGSLVATLAVALAAAAPSAPPSGFVLGVSSGDVTSSQATLWTRAPHAGALVVRYGTTAALDGKSSQARTTARPVDDLTVHVRLHRLRPHARYWYRFEQGKRRSDVGSFVTAPAPNDPAPVTFDWSGGADGTPNSTGKPAYGPFPALATAARDNPDFFAFVGSTIYADSPFANAPASTLAQYRARYRQNLAIPALRTLQRTTSVDAEWGDHEVRNDYTRDEVPPSQFDAAYRAFTDYQPIAPGPHQQLYRSFRWGRNLEVFLLDERSYRSPEADRGGACDNPKRSGRADIAPTLPGALRRQNATVYPQLALPVPKRCAAQLANPSATMLGAAQLSWLERGLERSNATFKVVFTEDPIEEYFLDPYDRWEGYQAERSALLGFIAAHDVRNVVWLTTSPGATLFSAVTRSTFPAKVETGMVEASVGPIGTDTFGSELAQETGDAAEQFTSSFLSRLGDPCVSLDRPSYGRVHVTATTLTIESVADDGASICAAPLTVTAR
jgi:phosphodiesterase/alkaline phosphatase D-like protein